MRLVLVVLFSVVAGVLLSAFLAWGTDPLMWVVTRDLIAEWIKNPLSL